MTDHIEDQNQNKDQNQVSNRQTDLDILKRVEVLTEKVNENMAGRGKLVFQRYPLTFTILVLFGAVAVGEGVKGILELIGFYGHPLYLFLLGMCILVLTGTLYKKLDK
jgi:hypothetical protein